MSQPYQIYDSTGRGRSFGRRPIVLARLPHVGAAAQPVGPTPVATQSMTFSEGTRFYVDAQHTRTPMGEPAPAQQYEQGPQATTYRHHHGPHRRPTTDQTTVARGPQSALATGMSEIHGQLTSYSGLIVTLALAASAALLYWMIIVPSQRPANDFTNSYDAFGATKVELPDFEFPSAPWVAPQVTSPVTSSDSLPVDPPEPSTDDEPAAVVAQQSPVHSDSLPAATGSPETSETPAPPAESAPELMPPSGENEEPELIYNDASASAYPTTAYPLAWDWTVLGVAEVASGSEAADAPTPAAVFR